MRFRPPAIEFVGLLPVSRYWRTTYQHMLENASIENALYDPFFLLSILLVLLFLRISDRSSAFYVVNEEDKT